MDGRSAGIPATLPPLGDLQAAFRAQGYVTGEALGTSLRLVVALGRPHLVDPSFTMRAAAWYGASDIACPPQYLPGKEQIFRNSVRDRQDFEDLKIKGKPKTRAELKAEATKPLAAE